MTSFVHFALEHCPESQESGAAGDAEHKARGDQDEGQTRRSAAPGRCWLRAALR